MLYPIELRVPPSTTGSVVTAPPARHRGRTCPLARHCDPTRLHNRGYTYGRHPPARRPGRLLPRLTEDATLIYRLPGPAAPLLLCLLLIPFTGCGGPSSEPAAVTAAASSPAGEVANETPFPLPVIRLAGDPVRIGADHGRELGGQIRELHGKYLNAYFTNPGRRMMAMAAAAAFESKVGAEHLAENHALAHASGVDRRQMLLAQCFLDLSAMTACSTVTLPADASPDGVARFGRNLDFPSFDVADKQTVVLIYRPGDRPTADQHREHAGTDPRTVSGTATDPTPPPPTPRATPSPPSAGRGCVASCPA